MGNLIGKTDENRIDDTYYQMMSFKEAGIENEVCLDPREYYIELSNNVSKK